MAELVAEGRKERRDQLLTIFQLRNFSLVGLRSAGIGSGEVAEAKEV